MGAVAGCGACAEVVRRESIQGAQTILEARRGSNSSLADRLRSPEELDMAPVGADDKVSDGEKTLFLRVIEKLEEHDEFLATDSDSEAGDSVADDVDYGDDRELLDAAQLDDPNIEDWELVNAWHKLRRHELPDTTTAENIIKAVTKLYAGEPNVVQLPRPECGQHLIVVGDLHGHLGDLLHIFNVHGEPKEGAGGTIFIFNGDFVDRGIYGPEVLLCLYCLKLQFPSAVHLNRGNHEDCRMNAQQGGGFRDFHCVRAWSQHARSMYRLIRRSFLCLPLVHVVGGEIAVIHGGLPLDRGVSLDEISRIARKRDVPVTSSCFYGYPPKQSVSAKQGLVSTDGQKIPVGTSGQIVQKLRESRSVEVLFKVSVGRTGKQKSAHVTISGAPELEQEVNIEFRSVHEKQLQRLDRIFVALLWSDPSDGDEAGPNTNRGAGSLFDANATDDFLKANNLQCLIRSHQKRGDGFQVEHRGRDHKPAAVTVFSASNYEQLDADSELAAHANLANVAIFYIDEHLASQPLLSAMKPANAWSDSHECGDGQLVPEDSVEANTTKSLKALQQASDSKRKDSVSQGVSSRIQALRPLWLLIYCCRPELAAFFENHDKEGTGKVSIQQWACIMRGCLIADTSFPWEELASHLASFDDHGMCHYHAFLMRYTNLLSIRLEHHWCKRALGRLFINLGEGTKAEDTWKELDRDHNGVLSYAELRPLLKENLTFSDTEETADEAIFCLLAKLDVDCSGFVEKNEFLEAVASGRQYVETDGKRASTRDDVAVDQCWVFLHNAMRALAKKHASASVLFRFFDKDNNGVLTREEFRSGLSALLPQSKEHESIRESFGNWEPLLWSMVDVDKSGSVSSEELQEALSVRQKL